MPASLGRALRPNPIAAAIRTNPTNSGEVQSAGRSKAPARAATARCDQITVPAGPDETRRNGHTVRPLAGTCAGHSRSSADPPGALARKTGRPYDPGPSQTTANVVLGVVLGVLLGIVLGDVPASHGSGQLVAIGQFALTDGAWRCEAFWSAAMDLDELCMGPFDRIGRRHALDGLRVHVDDDVLGLHLGCVLIGRPSIAPQPPGHRNLLERR
jgi:hypothetical protein